MAGRRLAVHGVCLLRLRASRPLRAVLDMRLLRLRASRPLRAVLDMRLLRMRAGRPLRAVLDMRLLRMRARRVLLLYRARAGSARLSLLLLRTAAGGLRRTLRWALRAGWLSFVTKQLIKVLKMIGHGLISLSTWNASLRLSAQEPSFPLGHKIRRRTETAPFVRSCRKTSRQIHAPRGVWLRKNPLRGERVLVMCCANNNNSCLWIILILILLFCCGGWGNCGCENNNSCGCGC